MHQSFSVLRGAAGGIAITALTAAVNGEIITIDPIDTPNCDVLDIPNLVHELGNPPMFPIVEAIETTFILTALPACPEMDDPDIPNVLVVMTNLSQFWWYDLHYVGDAGSSGPETFISNDDGLISGGLAFQIDTVGVNRPLVYQSGTSDFFFEPGETWHFIIQDYASLFVLPPSLMGTIGVGFGSSGDLMSSGSVIALPFPEPGPVALFMVSGLALCLRRRG